MMSKKYVIVIALVGIFSISAMVIPSYASEDTPEGLPGEPEVNSSACYDAGHDDGRNGEFESEAFYDNCGSTTDIEDNKYYEGFIDGCMSVEGNTRDVCESATDA
jgi:hypothetical protein